MLAIRCCARCPPAGHWYEGGGIYRPVRLEHVAATHVTRDGLFVPPEGDGSSITAYAELEYGNSFVIVIVIVVFFLFFFSRVLFFIFGYYPPHTRHGTCFA